MIALLPPLAEGGKVTKTRKDDAMYALAEAADALAKRPLPENDPWDYMSDKAWQLAEMRKWGKVRVIKDKKSKCWIATTYGSMNGVSGYYGVNINTGLMIPSDEAEEFFHKSRA